MKLRTKAFTLLEVLAALLILATAIFASVMVQGEAMRSARQLKRRAMALAAAESAMDAFLTAPVLQPSGTTFESDSVVEMPGYDEHELVVRRILREHMPFEEQESLYVNPPEEEEAETTLPGALTGSEETEEEDVFDPGTFVAVRIEVTDQQNPSAPLVVLETWLPKPPLPEEAEEGSTGQGDSTTPGGGSGRSPNADGGLLPATGSGGQPAGNRGGSGR